MVVILQAFSRVNCPVYPTASKYRCDNLRPLAVTVCKLEVRRKTDNSGVGWSGAARSREEVDSGQCYPTELSANL